MTDQGEEGGQTREQVKVLLFDSRKEVRRSWSEKERSFLAAGAEAVHAMHAVRANRETIPCLLVPQPAFAL